jgi:hypothetical protein
MPNGNIIVFILVVIIITSLAIAFRQKPNYNKVPRKIWSYDSDSIKGLSKTVALCQASWRKWNPDYEIVILSRKNYYNYITIPQEIANNPIFNEDPKRFESLVALYTLAEHGGVWISATTLLTEPLDNWLFPKYAQLSGFYDDSLSPIDASEDLKKPQAPILTLLACNKGCRFMKLWRNEFSEIIRFQNIEKYIENRISIGIDFPNTIDLAPLLAAQKVLQLDKYPTDSFLLQRISSINKHVETAKGQSEKALKLACLDKKYQRPLIHFRSEDLKTMEEQIEYDLSPDKCGWLD